MINKREELIRRNKNFIQIPMPDLSSMTDEQLENRASMFEKIFEIDIHDEEEEEL